MEIIEKRLDEIRPYERNPRRNDAAVQYVAESKATDRRSFFMEIIEKRLDEIRPYGHLPRMARLCRKNRIGQSQGDSSTPNDCG